MDYRDWVDIVSEPTINFSTQEVPAFELTKFHVSSQLFDSTHTPSILTYLSLGQALFAHYTV